MASIGGPARKKVAIQLHEIRDGKPRLLAVESYRAGAPGQRSPGARARVVEKLLVASRASVAGSVLVAGSTYGSNRIVLESLRDMGLAFVAELRASDLSSSSSGTPLKCALRDAEWRPLALTGDPKAVVRFSAARLDGITPHKGLLGQVFAAQTGGIEGLHRGTILAFASDADRSLEELLSVVRWARSIRRVLRWNGRVAETDRENARPVASSRRSSATTVPLLARANIALVDKQDRQIDLDERVQPTLSGKLGAAAARLNVVELFAGAGGMGLGFLLAPPAPSSYRIISSTEVNPIYSATLRRNHSELERSRKDAESTIPSCSPGDLRSGAVLDQITSTARSCYGAA